MPQLSVMPINEAADNIPDAPALRQLAAQIKEAVNTVEQHVRLAVHDALAAGKLLLEAKASVGHGQWEAWLAANCEMAPRTARAFMLLARKYPELPAANRQRVADLPLRQALRAIAMDPEAPPPSTASARAANGDDWDRAAHAFRACESSLHRAMQRMQKPRRGGGGDLQVRALREKLQAALEALDRITQVATVVAKPKSSPENEESDEPLLDEVAAP